MEMMISLPSSRGLSYAIYFDIPPHQLLYLTILCTEDAKKKKSKKRKKKDAGRLVRMWWQVPIQTLNINGGWSEAWTRTQSLPSALKKKKKHIAINCHPIFIFCQSVCAARLIPHTKRL